MTTSATPAAAPAISASALTRVYGTRKNRFTAVTGIDLTVAPGTVHGLLGTNGAGKTSTLEMLEGLAAPTSGRVTVLGLDPLAQRAAVRRRTGIMLQSGGLPGQLTTAETLTMWAGTCTSPRPVADVLDAVGLAHRTGVKTGTLSGGEQRRLDLACALVGGPDVLFLDEPTTGLDPESRRNVWELLDRLRADGATMVLTTHYLEEAERLCDRIAIMHEGRIAREGSLAELTAAVGARIVFRLPDDGARRLPDLPGAAVVRSGRDVTVMTSRLQHDTLEVLTWARSQALTLEGFAARPATLETVFLSIAGHGTEVH